MLKLMTVGLVVGGFMLSGCKPITDLDDQAELRPVGVEQEQQPWNKGQPVQSDTIHKVSAEFEN